MLRLTLPGNNVTNVLDVDVNECGLAPSWLVDTFNEHAAGLRLGMVGQRMNDPHDRLLPGGLGGPESRPFSMSRRNSTANPGPRCVSFPSSALTFAKR